MSTDPAGVPGAQVLSGQQPAVLFRADASSEIGGGHVMRCLALARALSGAGWHCTMACNEETIDTITGLDEHGLEIVVTGEAQDAESLAGQLDEEFELMVIDHYQLAADYHLACRRFTKNLLVIDELLNRQLHCDFLLDQSPGRSVADYKNRVPQSCQLMLGPRYALLRPVFAESRDASIKRRRDIERVERIIISFGASDIHKLSIEALRAIELVDYRGKVDVVLGGGSSNAIEIEEYAAVLDAEVTVHRQTGSMEQLMMRADLAIGGGGISSWERCTLGLPALVVMEAGNQQANVAGLDDAGAAINMGLATGVNSKIIAAHLEDILDDSKRLARMSLAASTTCDGRGVSRVMDNLLQ